jgi:hypothetical protein
MEKAKADQEAHREFERECPQVRPGSNGPIVVLDDFERGGVTVLSRSR